MASGTWSMPEPGAAGRPRSLRGHARASFAGAGGAAVREITAQPTPVATPAASGRVPQPHGHAAVKTKSGAWHDGAAASLAWAPA